MFLIFLPQHGQLRFMFTRVLGPHCVASTFLECTQTLSRALTALMDSCAEMKRSRIVPFGRGQPSHPHDTETSWLDTVRPQVTNRYNVDSFPQWFDLDERATDRLQWAMFMQPQKSLALSLLKCYFTSKETVGLLGTGAQDVHLDFHTDPKLWLCVVGWSVALHQQKP